MNRLRAGYLALLASALLMSTAARAATIDVTTLLDPPLPANDNLCSIREAVAASLRAGALITHDSSRVRLEEFQDELEAAMALRLQFDGEYYDRTAINGMLALMESELVFETPSAGPETTTRDNLLLDVRLLQDAVEDLPDEHVYLCDADSVPACPVYPLRDPPEPPITSPGYPDGIKPGVQQTYDLLRRTQAQADLEIERLNARNAADGCEDGSSFDTVKLPAGVHVLNSELVINARVNLRGEGDSTIITRGTLDNRLLNVPARFKSTISDLQLQGGRAGAGDGGALYAGGEVTLENLLFTDNTARDGGAIFVDLLGTLAVSNVRFHANSATRDGGAVAAVGTNISFTDTRFSQADLRNPVGPGNLANTAAGLGGAIFFNPQGTLDEEVFPYVYEAAPGGLSLSRVLAFGNAALAGSAIFIGPNPVSYDESSDASLSVVNSTFGQNIAAAGATIDVATTASVEPVSAAVQLNNVTMLENNGGTGTGGIRVANWLTLVVANTLLADNPGSGPLDCDLNVNTFGSAMSNRNYFQFGSACPGSRWSLGNPTGTNYELASGDAAIDPDGLTRPFDPVAGIYLPIYPIDITDTTEKIRLVGRGASTQESYRCVEVDQRNLERLSFVDSDCDIGAVEYQVGRSVEDFVQVLVNERSCLVFTDNDAGDTEYAPGTLSILSVERPGAQAVVASRNIAGYTGGSPVVPFDAAHCPNYAELLAHYDPVNLDPDQLPVEVILFTPPPNFHGETNLTYSFGWTTEIGSTTAASGTIGSVAHIRTESGAGITSDSLGASPLLALLLLLGLRGGRGRNAWRQIVATALALLLAGPAVAVDNVIYVNSLVDTDPLAGDRLCTLREALETARNDTSNLTGGDCVNGNEGPDIVEFVYNPATYSGPLPPVLRVTLANTLVAYGSVTIRCPIEKYPELTCVIDGGNALPLIDSRGSIGIVGMLLENGSAGATPSGPANGGAINSYGAVSIVRSALSNNTAVLGGAIFLRGNLGDLSISESTFTGNASSSDVGTDGGGAVAMAAGSQHKIEISSSTFVGNRSVRGAAVLNLKTTTTAVIANSTFSDNRSEKGPGAIDLSGVSTNAVLRNVTLVDNYSGDLGATRYAALQGGGTSQHRLLNVIVAANFDYASYPGPGQDRNCSDSSGATLSGQFSLFGESNLFAPTCPAGGSNQLLDALTVYDRAAPASGYLLALADNGGLTFTHKPNILLPGALTTIVDQGYNLRPVVSDNLVDPLEISPAGCANVDQRGESRTAGGRCDIGAFEYDVVTAVDDAASNRGRHDRLAISDVLVNDQAPVGRECKANRVSAPGELYPPGAAYIVTNLPPLPTLPVGALPGSEMRAVWAYDDSVSPAAICALVFFNALEGEATFLPLIPAPLADQPDRKLIDDGDTWDDVIHTTSDVVLSYRDCNTRRVMMPTPEACDTVVSDPVDVADDWADALMKEVGARELEYQAGDLDGNFSSASVYGKISVSILNVPPFVYPETVYPERGETVRINVLANDFDYDTGIDPPPLNIESCPGTDPNCSRYYDWTKMPLLSPNGLNLDSLKVTGCNDEDDITDIDRDGITSEIYQACEFGDVFVDNTTGVITWIPRNAFNPFSETIIYQVSDYAYPEADQRNGRLTIIPKDRSSNGGAIFGDDDLSDMLGIDWLGAGGNLFLVFLGLTALRRRR